MSLEDDLRASLRAGADAAPDGTGLDARAAIAGARRRRRPRVAVATGATALAAVGVLAIAMPVVLQPFGGFSSTSGGAPMSDQVEIAESQAGVTDESAASFARSSCGVPTSEFTRYVPSNPSPAAEVSVDLVSTAIGDDATTSLVLDLENLAPAPVSVSYTSASFLVDDGTVVGVPLDGPAGTTMSTTPIALAVGERIEITISNVFELCDGSPATTASDAELSTFITVSSIRDDGTAGSSDFGIDPEPRLIEP